MRCPTCGCTDSRVIDSRPVDGNDAIRRRRECTQCGMRFTTYERREDVPLVVIKKDGHKEPFDKEKIMHGLTVAMVKREVPMESLVSLINDVEASVRDKGTNEVESKEIGRLVLTRLIDVDKVAYIRFASVYRDFKDVDEFTEELRRLADE